VAFSRQRYKTFKLTDDSLEPVGGLSGLETFKDLLLEEIEENPSAVGYCIDIGTLRMVAGWIDDVIACETCLEPMPPITLDTKDPDYGVVHQEIE
jgi:hypothetical protein